MLKVWVKINIFCQEWIKVLFSFGFCLLLGNLSFGILFFCICKKDILINHYLCKSILWGKKRRQKNLFLASSFTGKKIHFPSLFQTLFSSTESVLRIEEVNHFFAKKVFFSKFIPKSWKLKTETNEKERMLARSKFQISHMY